MNRGPLKKESDHKRLTTDRRSLKKRGVTQTQDLRVVGGGESREPKIIIRGAKT